MYWLNWWRTLTRLASNRAIWLVASVCWMALLFWLSSSPDAQGGGWLLGLFPYADKVIHAVAYGILALLLYGATRRTWLAVLLTSLYGITDEIHQHFVPGRSADGFDWLADTVGATLAVLLLGLFVRFLTQRRRP